MASTMTSTLPPRRSDHPLRRAFVVIAVIVLMLVIAILKPWDGGGPSAGQPTLPPGAAGSLLPAITGGPASETSPVGS
jgi:hypothetical protein